MNALNQLSGFWRLWVVLSILWIAGIYVDYKWWEISAWFSPLPRLVLPVPDGWEEVAAAKLRKFLLFAFGPPIAALVVAGLARWIGDGFKGGGS